MTKQEKRNYEAKYNKQQKEIEELKGKNGDLRNILMLEGLEKDRLRKALRHALKLAGILSHGISHTEERGIRELTREDE